MEFDVSKEYVYVGTENDLNPAPFDIFIELVYGMVISVRFITVLYNQ